MPHLSGRVLNVLIGIDETVNSLLGGLPRETISGTIGRALLQDPVPAWAKAARVVVDGIFGPGHCLFNGRAELARRAALDVLPTDEQ